MTGLAVVSPFFLYLAPLAALPVLFHLYFRRRLKEVFFFSFMFMHRAYPYGLLSLLFGGPSSPFRRLLRPPKLRYGIPEDRLTMAATQSDTMKKSALLLLMVIMFTASGSAGWWPFSKKSDGSVKKGESKETQAAPKDDANAKGKSGGAKGFLGLSKGRGPAVSPVLTYIDEARSYERVLPLEWNLEVGQPVSGISWIGTTYKDIPYSDKEREALAEEMLMKELEILKKDHLIKKKQILGEGGGGVDVKNLLDQLVGDAKEENSDKDKENAKASAKNKDQDAELLKDFDEGEARKKLVKRIIVPRSKKVETRALFFQLAGGDLYCVELQTGITAWVIRLDGMLDAVPFETKESVCFILGGYLQVIDKQAGLLLHRSILDQAMLPAVFSNRSGFFLASYRKRVLSWVPKGNFAAWSSLMTSEISGGVYGNEDNLLVAQEGGEFTALDFDGTKKWAFVNKGVAEDIVYYERELRKIQTDITKEEAQAKKDDREVDKIKVRGLEIKAKEMEAQLDLLNSRTRGAFLSPPVTKGDSIFIGSTDYNLYRLNRYTGLPDWQYICKDKIVESPFAGDRLVWQRDIKGILHGVDQKTGKAQEMIQGVASVLQAGEDAVFFLDSQKRLLVKSEFGLARIEGLAGYHAVIPVGTDILAAISPGATVVSAYSLAPVRH